MPTPPIPMQFDPRSLEGLDLQDGWQIDTYIERSADQTGGNFSLGYLGSDNRGRRGFIKVINYYRAMFSLDPATALQQITENYNFERDLVERCGLRRLTRVVSSYAHGTIQNPGTFPVSYIVFELAEHDIRKALDVDASIDLTAKLRLAHNATAGAAQLHGIGVAHQDIKPSNLLVFPELQGNSDSASKLADLGRASDQHSPARHDIFTIAGDPTYAPPEQRYGTAHPDFERRRLACDVYQIGNLISFILTGTTVNSRIHSILDPQHAPENWGGPYEDVLAYVQAAHSAAIFEIMSELKGPLASRICDLIQCLTDPVVEQRGHPGSRRAGEPYALNRVVTELDLLCRRSAVIAAGVAA
jgi:serine/threonine protein kinase